MASGRAQAAMESMKPLLDRIGERNVNGFLLIVYLAFWGWGVASFLFIPIHSNVGWPIAQALAYAIVVTLVHFLFIAIGATLVPDYTYYPLEPLWVYMISDGVIFFSFVGVVASYLLHSMSSAVPLVGIWLMLIALAAHVWKLFSLVVWEKPKKEALIGA